MKLDICRFAASMCYYGLAQNTSGLPGAPFISFVALALAELPGGRIDSALVTEFIAYLLAIPLMERLGRRATLIIFYLLGGVSCIAVGALKESMFVRKSALRHSTLAGDNQSIKDTILVLALVGKMGVSGAFAIIYNYSAEFFPTVARQAGTGFGSLFARFGSMLAPQIILLVSRLYITQLDSSLVCRVRRSMVTCHSLCTALFRALLEACASFFQKHSTERCLTLLKMQSISVAGL